MKEYTFHQDLYDAEITYLIGGTVNDLKKFLRGKHNGRIPTMWSWDTKFSFGRDGDTTNGYAFHVNAPLGDGEVFYVWLTDPPDLLFHETYHLTGDILFTRGIGYTYQSEEAYAYLGSWLYKTISSLIEKKDDTIS